MRQKSKDWQDPRPFFFFVPMGTDAKTRMLGKQRFNTPEHTSPTCSPVKLDGIIMMSESSRQLANSLQLLARPRWLTHVAPQHGSTASSCALCQRNLSFLRKDVGNGLAGVWRGSWREPQAFT